jgi:dihydrofolate reductase
VSEDFLLEYEDEEFVAHMAEVLGTEVQALTAQDGGPILAHGGVRFAQSLVRADLVDEYHLLVSPVAHGGGGPLFTEFTRLTLVDVKSFPRGNLALTYSRMR